MRWIETYKNGPFLLLPYERREEWDGKELVLRNVHADSRWDYQLDATDYDEALDKKDGGTIKRANFTAVVLPGWGAMTWIERDLMLIHCRYGYPPPEIARKLREWSEDLTFKKTR